MTLNRVLVVSAIVHALAFACIMHAKAPLRSRTVEAAPVAASEIEVETPEHEATPQAPVPAPAPTSEEVAIATSRRIGRALSVGPVGSAGVTGDGAPSSPEPAVAGSNSTWVVNLGQGTVVGPFQAQQRLGASRQEAEAQERAAQGPRKDSSLKDALAIQDAAKGLGADGPVLHALEDETRLSLAPLRGVATFRAIVDAAGTVTGLSVIDSTGDAAGWNDARDRALAALQKKKLDLRGAKNGVMFDIRVESQMRLPSGQLVGEHDIGVRDGMLTLGGDVSDLGSKATRVVHARLASYTPL